MKRARTVVLSMVLNMTLALSLAAEPDATAEAAAAARAELERVVATAKQPMSGALHDACGALIYAGTDASVPSLIRALRLFPDQEPGPNEGVMCTQKHCIDALERITHQKVGYSYSLWVRWWNAAHPGQPFERLPNQPLQPAAAAAAAAER